MCPVGKLTLIDPKTFFDLIRAYSQGKKGTEFNLDVGCSVGAEISDQIIEYIKNNSPTYPSLFKIWIALLKTIKRKIGF